MSLYAEYRGHLPYTSINNYSKGSVAYQRAKQIFPSLETRLAIDEHEVVQAHRDSNGKRDSVPAVLGYELIRIHSTCICILVLFFSLLLPFFFVFILTTDVCTTRVRVCAIALASNTGELSLKVARTFLAEVLKNWRSARELSSVRSVKQQPKNTSEDGNQRGTTDVSRCTLANSSAENSTKFLNTRASI